MRTAAEVKVCMCLWHQAHAPEQTSMASQKWRRIILVTDVSLSVCPWNTIVAFLLARKPESTGCVNNWTVWVNSKLTWIEYKNVSSVDIKPSHTQRNSNQPYRTTITQFTMQFLYITVIFALVSSRWESAVNTSYNDFHSIVADRCRVRSAVSGKCDRPCWQHGGLGQCWNQPHGRRFGVRAAALLIDIFIYKYLLINKTHHV